MINVKHLIAFALSGIGLGWVTSGVVGMVIDRLVDALLPAVCKLAPAVCMP